MDGLDTVNGQATQPKPEERHKIRANEPKGDILQHSPQRRGTARGQLIMDSLIKRFNTDNRLSRHGAYYSTHISIVCGDDRYHFDINQRQVSTSEVATPDHGYSLVGSAETWEKFCQDVPPPEHHELGAMLATGHIVIEGDMQIMQSNMMYIRRFLEIWRDSQREKEK